MSKQDPGDDPRFDDVDENDPVVRQAMALERSRRAQRGHHTRRLNKRAPKPGPPLLIDALTGEVLTAAAADEGRVRYTEGTTSMLLPPGMSKVDVPPPACENNFVQVCRDNVDLFCDYLVLTHHITALQQTILLRLVFWADSETGVVDKTHQGIAEAVGMSRPSVSSAIAGLAAHGVIVSERSRGRRPGVVRLVELDRLMHLSVRERVNRGYRLMLEQTRRDVVTKTREWVDVDGTRYIETVVEDRSVIDRVEGDSGE